VGLRSHEKTQTLAVVRTQIFADNELGFASSLFEDEWIQCKQM
jgi:hypothetical protein